MVGPTRSPNGGGPNTGALIRLYFPQIISFDEAFQFTLISYWSRSNFVVLPAPKVWLNPNSPVPVWLGRGAMLWMRFQIGLMRLSGIMLFGNGVRPVPSGFPVIGS